MPFRADRVLLRRMLVYSLPLVPNLLSWWFVSVSGRYVVLWHSGVVAAGLFTAASKMPSLINIVASVFQQAWQYSDGPRDRLSRSGRVLRRRDEGLLPGDPVGRRAGHRPEPTDLPTDAANGVLGGLAVCPLLMLVASFGVISIFFESFYQALKNSGILMASTMLGAVVNVVLAVVLVPFMGPWGAGLAGGGGLRPRSGGAGA